jgi:hypothetical protein
MRFIVLAISVITIDIVIVACGNRHGESFLSQTGLNETTERDPHHHCSHSESKFRKHARDKKGLFPAMQVFLLHFCNVIVRQGCYSPGVPLQGILSLGVGRWTLGVEG